MKDTRNLKKKLKALREDYGVYVAQGNGGQAIYTKREIERVEQRLQERAKNRKANAKRERKAGTKSKKRSPRR